MKIKKTLTLTLGVAIAAHSCTPKKEKNNALQKEETKPNILVFIADDAGMDFGCYGNKVIKTPNIDRLAAEGLKYENAFVTAPQCSPCRTSILSGKFAHTIGTEDLHVGIDSTTVLLPTYLQEGGYYTGLMLKHHIGEHGTDQFQYFNDSSIWPDYYGTGAYHDKMMGYFEEFLNTAGDTPFFLWMGFVDPHRPYTDDKVLKNRAPEVHDPSKVIVPPYLDDNDSTRMDIAHYYDEIYRMDNHIGEMLDELKKRGKLDNTLVIFFSDNGMPFPRAKMTCYDSGIKTPFIAWWKNKIKAGTTYQELVSMIDLSPTILDVAGMNTPDDMYGKSFMPTFFDKDEPGREFIFAERNEHGEYDYIRAVRTKQYKLIYNGVPKYGLHCDEKNPTGREMRRRYERNELNSHEKHCFIQPEPKIELFDVQKDPYELNNLAGKPEVAEIEQNLIKVLKHWQIQTEDIEPDSSRFQKN